MLLNGLGRALSRKRLTALFATGFEASGVRGTGQFTGTLGRSPCFAYDSALGRNWEQNMDFGEALNEIENGARVRRDSWHKGRRWIARQEKDGFAEYVMAHAQDDQTIEWPLAMGRAD